MPANSTAALPELRCSFCGKSQKRVKKLIAGPGVYICEECIALCNAILEESSSAPSFIATLHEKSDEELIDLMVSFHASHEGIDTSTRTVVRALRERAVAWARIGEALGMTRQSAWERFSGEE